MLQVRTLFQRLPATKEDKKRTKISEVEDELKRIFWKVMKENNWKAEDFTAKETKEERSVS